MKKNKSVNIATIIIVILAIVVGIIAILKIADMDSLFGGEKPPQLTQEEVEAIDEKAVQLVSHNFLALRLFLIEGLPTKEEPYGNQPEDGFYTVDKTYDQLAEMIASAIGTSPSEKKEGAALYSQIEEFVNMVFIPSEANRLLNGSGNSTGIYSDRDGKLGIAADFKVMEYTKKFENVIIMNSILTENECSIKIVLNDISKEDFQSGNYEDDDVLTVRMLKLNGEWRLENLVY